MKQSFKRTLAWLICVALLCTLLPVGVFTASAATPIDVNKVMTYGRTYVKDDTLYLYWTNSGIAFNFTGTGATATLTSSNTNMTYLGTVNVYVDGSFHPTTQILLTQASQVCTLASGLSDGPHTIELRKRNEAAYGGSATIGIQTLDITDGELTEAPVAPSRQIEVVGDSITSGFGNMADASATGYTTSTADGTLTYAVLAAKELDANASIVSRSGIHYCHSKKADNTTPDNFYEYYAKTAALPGNTGDATDWDFADTPNDVVVINLGTNDVGAGRDAATYTSDAVDFLHLVREKNPNAVIIWTYGMMGNSIQSSLQAAVKQVADAGDSKVFYLPLENYVASTEGVALGHPTVQTDINRSVVLSAFIAEKTGWTMNAKPMLQAQLWYSNSKLLVYIVDVEGSPYTSASIMALKAAMDNGKGVLDAADSTNEDYIEAANAIWMAYNGLTLKSEMSGDYLVIDRCDNTNGAQFVPAAGALDTDDYKEGDGCLSNSGDSGLVCINHSNYNVTMPENFQDWYLEGWIYVDHPENISGGSCLEVSQVVDQIEFAFALDGIGLKSGWNKVQLKISNANGKDKLNEFVTLKNIRMFAVNVKGELTIKMDNFVLAKGKVAANTDDWTTALNAAQAQLGVKEDAALRAVYTEAQTAVTQADVDAWTVRLNKAVAAAKSTVPQPVDASKVTLYGRTVMAAKTLYLYWTNSGFSFKFNGTGATATLTSTNTNPIYLAYLNVYVDGAFVPTQTICLDKNTGVYTLAEGLPAGEHTIEVRKRNEAIYGGSGTIGVKTLNVTDGDFLAPPAAPAHQIEVIGDSITSGFGNMITNGSGDFTTSTEEGTMTYAVLAAKELGANASILSRSGIHYCHSAKADNTTPDNFYDYYTKTASLPGNVLSKAEWDFESVKNDVVVINLGTNDVGAGRTAAVYTSDAVDFIKLVRSKNPDAVIIWTYGLMGNSIQSALKAAVQQVNDEGDAKVFYLPLANYVSTTEGKGSAGHPTIQTDINRSTVLAQFIAEKTGWTMSAKPQLEAQLQHSAQYNTTENLANYTAESAGNFKAMITAGEATLAKADATSAEYAEAANNIWKAYVSLMSNKDRAEEYTVVCPMDTKTGWSIAGASKVDTEDFVEGAGCISTTWTSGGMININTSTPLNVKMPDGWQDWYLEFWMYADNPENIPGGSCIEISQVVDSVELQWGLDGLDLKSGWNKVQLQLSTGGTPTGFETLKNVRIFVVNMKGDPLTIKVDNIVLAKGKAAAKTTKWTETVAAAAELLKTKENAQLREAYEWGRTAKTQADMDASVVRLEAAIAAASAAGKLGDVDGDGKITTTDARLTLQFTAEKIGEDKLDTTVADVDKDTKITTTDARLILQVAAEKITSFD